MFLVQFQCSNKFGSVRSALHQRVPSSATEAHLSRLEEPEWATSDRLSYEKQEGRTPFSNCSPSFGSFFNSFSFGYTFQILVSIRMLDQLLDGHQNCCMWPSQNLTMPPSVQEWKCKQAGINMPFFGLCRPRALCVGATNHLQRLPCDNIGCCCWQPSPDTIIQTQQCHKMFICFGHGDGRQLNGCFAVVANAVAWGVACQGERKQRRSITEEQEISVRVMHQCTNRSIYITRAYRTFIHSHSIR